MALHEGTDHRIRTVSIKCRVTTLRRPIQRLFLLESCALSDDEPMKDATSGTTTESEERRERSKRSKYPPLRYIYS